MELLDAIHTRRSIRKYEPRSVPGESIREILRAAMMAPSAGNAQPWQFVVVTEKARLAKIARIHQYAGMAAKAPLGIAVCGDLSLEKYPGFWVQDCSAAMQNLLLAAHALGLGAVWLGEILKNAGEVRTLLEVPEEMDLMAVLAIGHPADKSVKSSSRKKISEVLLKTI